MPRALEARCRNRGLAEARLKIDWTTGSWLRLKETECTNKPSHVAPANASFWSRLNIRTNSTSGVPSAGSRSCIRIRARSRSLPMRSSPGILLGRTAADTNRRAGRPSATTAALTIPTSLRLAQPPLDRIRSLIQNLATVSTAGETGTRCHRSAPARYQIPPATSCMNSLLRACAISHRRPLGNPL